MNWEKMLHKMFISFLEFITKRVGNDSERLRLVNDHANELCREQASKLAPETPNSA